MFEFGPTVIRCSEKDYPVMAFRIYGQLLRCEFAKKKLGSEWGGERGEKSKFVDTYTNQSLNAIEFIRDGFQHVRNDTCSTTIEKEINC